MIFALCPLVDSTENIAKAVTNKPTQLKCSQGQAAKTNGKGKSVKEDK